MLKSIILNYFNTKYEFIKNVKNIFTDKYK